MSHPRMPRVRAIEGLHPHDESIQRGPMIEIDVSSWGANETVLFAGSTPLVFL